MSELENIKEGDEFFKMDFDYEGKVSALNKVKVVKVTKTTVTTTNGRFSRKTGEMIGFKDPLRHKPMIHFVTEDLCKAYDHMERCIRLRAKMTRLSVLFAYPMTRDFEKINDEIEGYIDRLNSVFDKG